MAAKTLFDPSLAPRAGEYNQYHHGDINAYHLSYFRRKQPDERRVLFDMADAGAVRVYAVTL